MTTPFTVDARTQLAGVFQTVNARIRAMANARGMALGAGHLKPTIKTKMATIGKEAINASTPVDMVS